MTGYLPVDWRLSFRSCRLKWQEKCCVFCFLNFGDSVTAGGRLLHARGNARVISVLVLIDVRCFFRMVERASRHDRLCFAGSHPWTARRISRAVGIDVAQRSGSRVSAALAASRQ